MSILDRDALLASPLADLHALASELSIDGYRRLRKADLIDAILTRQGGGTLPEPEEASSASSGDASEAGGSEAGGSEAGGSEAGGEEAGGEEGEEDEERPAGRRRRGRRGGRGRGAAREDENGARASDDDDEEEPAAEEIEEAEEDEADDEPASRTTRRRRGSRSAGDDEPEESGERTTRRRRGSRSAGDDEPEESGDGATRGRGRGSREPEVEEEVEGEIELLPNGSGFLRVHPPEPSEDDVYVSAAQVKRCELVPGDRISGPRRAPRRSERFASLIRIDTINGRPADEVADSTRFDDLPATFPSERFRLGSDDPTVKAIEWLAPFGQGSRVAIVGPPRAGKTEALRRLAASLAGQEEIQVSVVLAGVRPEEISEWQDGPAALAAAVSFAASADTQAQTIERVVDQARRLAARGSHAVVLIDTLTGIQPHAARKLLASARNIVDGGSLTVIATASEPLGGENTVIALDPALASTGRFPAIDLLASWTIRADLLVGEAGAEAIARARMEAIDR